MNDDKPLAGVRVIEAAIWMFGPACGAILSDLGADVIKVEHPRSGDPQRGISTSGMQAPSGARIPDGLPYNAIANRGKRSVGLDLGHPLGRDALYRLCAKADVFLTNFLAPARAKLSIDVADIRAHNPRIIYARATGTGTRGPEADRGGYDLATGWGRAGTAFKLTPEGGEPPMMPPSFFDLQGSMALAAAIATALFKRERTGHASVVDASLLNAGMWPLGPDIVMAPYLGEMPRWRDRRRPGSPTVNWYRTADGRWLYLVHLESDRYWPELCRAIGRADLIDDPRFSSHATRIEHQEACVAILDGIFAARTLAQWTPILNATAGVWAPVQSPAELHADPQVVANGMLPRVTGQDGLEFSLVAPPFQFDERAPSVAGPAPEAGQHTEEILLDLGLGWDEIEAGKAAGAFQ
ncbi:MAG: CaiB/BaiF CoA transferase family protein [Gammaproteobacteria bacterium]